MKYKVLETSISLLIAYETLALGYKAAKKRREPIRWGNESVSEEPTKHFNNYNHSFALLVLNASIIEGTLRSILSEKIIDDIDLATEKGKRAGRTEPTKPEQLMYKLRDEIELQGGWDKLKGQYSFYLDISLDKDVSGELKEAINTLFVLRNILAHGTAIVQPTEKIDDALKDEYPYSWQRKIQQARVYLSKKFGHEDVFDNLAEFDVPVHFLDMTKKYLNEVSEQVTPMPERASKTLELLNGYTFGYMCNSR